MNLNSLEEYKVIYYVLVFICFIIGIMSNSFRLRKKHYIVYGFILLFALWIGGRPLDIGTDTIAYKYMFESQKGIPLFSGVYQGDLLFIFISRIGVNWGNYQFCFFAVSFLTLLFTYLFAKKLCKEEYVGSSLLLFFCILATHIYFNQQFNIIRSGLSISILYFFFYAIYKKQHIPALIYGTVAIGLHMTMLIPIVILLFIHFFPSLNIKYCIYIYLIAIILSYLGYGVHTFSDFLLGSEIRQIQSYLNGNDFEYKIGFRIDFVIFNSFFLIWFLYLRNRLKGEDLFLDYSIKYYLLTSTIFFLWFYIPFSDRVGAYSWNIIPIILYVSMCKSFPREQKTYGILTFISIYIINFILFVV